MLKTILGIGGGLTLSGIAQIGRYEWGPHHPFESLWVTIALIAKLAYGFGAYHFAKYRGYSGGAGIGLYLLAFAASVFMIVFFGMERNTAPNKSFIFLFFDVFDIGLPVAVFLAMPQKDFSPHRMRSRSNRSRRG